MDCDQFNYDHLVLNGLIPLISLKLLNVKENMRLFSNASKMLFTSSQKNFNIF